MTDRELLELAAKAAGIALDEDCQNPRYRQAHEVLPEWVYWNPLADDGDALRLAVTLGIGIRSHLRGHWQLPCTSVALWNVGDLAGRVEVAHGDNAGKATRHAIVSAAAAIGKEMP